MSNIRLDVRPTVVALDFRWALDLNIQSVTLHLIMLLANIFYASSTDLAVSFIVELVYQGNNHSEYYLNQGPGQASHLGIENMVN